MPDEASGEQSEKRPLINPLPDTPAQSQVDKKKIDEEELILGTSAKRPDHLSDEKQTPSPHDITDLINEDDILGPGSETDSLTEPKSGLRTVKEEPAQEPAPKPDNEAEEIPKAPPVATPRFLLPQPEKPGVHPKQPIKKREISNENTGYRGDTQGKSTQAMQDRVSDEQIEGNSSSKFSMETSSADPPDELEMIRKLLKKVDEEDKAAALAAEREEGRTKWKSKPENPGKDPENDGEVNVDRIDDEIGLKNSSQPSQEPEHSVPLRSEGKVQATSHDDLRENAPTPEVPEEIEQKHQIVPTPANPSKEAVDKKAEAASTAKSKESTEPVAPKRRDRRPRPSTEGEPKEIVVTKEIKSEIIVDLTMEDEMPKPSHSAPPPPGKAAGCGSGVGMRPGQNNFLARIEPTDEDDELIQVLEFPRVLLAAVNARLQIIFSTPETDTVSCAKCGKGFRNGNEIKAEIIRHIFGHFNRPAFKCAECGHFERKILNHFETKHQDIDVGFEDRLFEHHRELCELFHLCFPRIRISTILTHSRYSSDRPTTTIPPQPESRKRPTVDFPKNVEVVDLSEDPDQPREYLNAVKDVVTFFGSAKELRCCYLGCKKESIMNSTDGVSRHVEGHLGKPVSHCKKCGEKVAKPRRHWRQKAHPGPPDYLDLRRKEQPALNTILKACFPLISTTVKVPETPNPPSSSADPSGSSATGQKIMEDPIIRKESKKGKTNNSAIDDLLSVPLIRNKVLRSDPGDTEDAIIVVDDVRNPTEQSRCSTVGSPSSSLPTERSEGSGSRTVSSVASTKSSVADSRSPALNAQLPTKFFAVLDSARKNLKLPVLCGSFGCTTEFNKHTDLEDHIMKHFGQKLYRCLICDQKISSGISSHVEEEHGKRVEPKHYKDLRFLYQEELIRTMKRCLNIEQAPSPLVQPNPSSKKSMGPPPPSIPQDEADGGFEKYPEPRKLFHLMRKVKEFYPLAGQDGLIKCQFKDCGQTIEDTSMETLETHFITHFVPAVAECLGCKDIYRNWSLTERHLCKNIKIADKRGIHEELLVKIAKECLPAVSELNLDAIVQNLKTIHDVPSTYLSQLNDFVAALEKGMKVKCRFPGCKYNCSGNSSTIRTTERVVEDHLMGHTKYIKLYQCLICWKKLGCSPEYHFKKWHPIGSEVKVQDLRSLFEHELVDMLTTCFPSSKPKEAELNEEEVENEEENMRPISQLNKSGAKPKASRPNSVLEILKKTRGRPPKSVNDKKNILNSTATRITSNDDTISESPLSNQLKVQSSSKAVPNPKLRPKVPVPPKNKSDSKMVDDQKKQGKATGVESTRVAEIWTTSAKEEWKYEVTPSPKLNKSMAGQLVRARMSLANIYKGMPEFVDTIAEVYRKEGVKCQKIGCAYTLKKGAGFNTLAKHILTHFPSRFYKCKSCTALLKYPEQHIAIKHGVKNPDATMYDDLRPQYEPELVELTRICFSNSYIQKIDLDAMISPVKEGGLGESDLMSEASKDATLDFSAISTFAAE